jgi:ribosome-associated protein
VHKRGSPRVRYIGSNGSKMARRRLRTLDLVTWAKLQPPRTSAPASPSISPTLPLQPSPPSTLSSQPPHLPCFCPQGDAPSTSTSGGVPPSARQTLSAWSTQAPGSSAGAPIPSRRRLRKTGDDGLDLALSLALVGDELKGQDVLVLKVAEIVNWTSFMVLVTAMNRPQMQAMLFKMEKEARDRFGRTLSINPTRGGEWELLDYGNVVVNVLTAQQREYYALETMYATAEEAVLEDFLE